MFPFPHSPQTIKSTMPKLNRRLIASMIEDLKEFVSVSNEMCSWIGKVEHLSWRFPTRSARNVNAIAILEKHDGSAGEMYIMLLEMAYDRIHFVLRLVVEFMESYPFVDDFFEDLGKVNLRPKSMSMANVIRALWQRLKLVPETVARNMVKTKRVDDSIFADRKSRGSQTTSGSLLYCESCSQGSTAVQELMRIVSTALEEEKLSSVILEERKVICPEYLFGKTQWAVMRKFVGAVENDIKTLLDATSAIRAKSKTDFEEREISMRNFLMEIEKLRIEKESLGIKIDRMTEQLLAVQSELRIMKNKNMGLIEENRRLTESVSKTKEKFANFETLLAVNMKRAYETAETELALEKSVKNLHQELIAERKTSTSKIEILKNNLDSLGNENCLMEKQHREEIEYLKEEHELQVRKLEEYARLSVPIISVPIDRSLTEVEVQTEDRFNGCETAEIPEAKGDPEIDMGRQLASNEEMIEKLRRQNERLSRTLTRLKEYRRVSENR